MKKKTSTSQWPTPTLKSIVERVDRLERKQKDLVRKKKLTPLDIIDTFTSPESSNVEGGSYSNTTQQAVIAFRDKKDSGAATVYYAYEGMTRKDWEGLKGADSKGKYMQGIKRQYRGRLLNG